MAKQVTKWASKGGTLFDSEAEADAHDELHDLRDELDKFYNDLDEFDTLAAARHLLERYTLMPRKLEL